MDKFTDPCRQGGNGKIYFQTICESCLSGKVTTGLEDHKFGNLLFAEG